MESHRNRTRRYQAYVSSLGTTQIHLRSPLIIAWWSAALPGFGHLLLSKYIRGFVLVFWEFIINTNANINNAMIYSFTGHFELAKLALDTKWMLLYIPVYLYAIWDSYRTAVDLNKIYILAKNENHSFAIFQITGFEINYLDKRKPWVAAMWSAFMPGTGQLYIHRIIIAFVMMIWWIFNIYSSRILEGVYFLTLGKLNEANHILRSEWFLYLPSLYFFSIYDAYVNTVENNKLFDNEQKTFLKKHFQKAHWMLQDMIAFKNR